jgi:rhodanese-related sulfurtransferase
MTVTRVSPQEAEALVREEGYVYVDVRSIPEFDAGHPAGAYNVPLMHQTAGGMAPNADFIGVMTSSFDKGDKLVLGCRSGGRSLRAAEMLLAAGFTDVVDQRAGWGGARDAFGQVQEPGWEGAGLPTATTADAGRDYESLRGKR